MAERHIGYYRRLAGQIASDSFSHFRREIMIGAISGALAALVARKVGWIPKASVIWTLLIALLPYTAMMAVAFAFHAIRAPAKLDNRRRSRARCLRESAKRRVDRERQVSREQADQFTKEKAALEGEMTALATKTAISPQEKSRSDFVSEKLRKCEPADLMILKRLLLSGNAFILAVQQDREIQKLFQNAFIAQSALNRCVEARLVTLVPGSTDRVEINPSLENALSFHLLREPDPNAKSSDH